jgi:hypothetical protein
MAFDPVDRIEEICNDAGDAKLTRIAEAIGCRCVEFQDRIKAMELAFRLLQEDNHNWSTRPCSTCQGITELIGKPFGCVEYKLRKAAKERDYRELPCEGCGKGAGNFFKIIAGRLYCGRCAGAQTGKET